MATPSTPYTGSPVALKLPVPLDPDTLNVWAGQLRDHAFQPLQAGLNQVIDYLAGGTATPLPVLPPLVVIQAPLAGVTLTGRISVTARAAAVAPITGVALYNGTTKVADLVNTTGPVWVASSVDTTSWPDGTTTLVVRVTDQAGNNASDTITVTVANAVNPTPTPETGDVLTLETGIGLTTESSDLLGLDLTPVVANYTLTTEAGVDLTTEDLDVLVTA